MDWPQALRNGLVSDIGVLWGALIPLLVLAAGVVGLIPDLTAILWAMLSGVGLLILLPIVWLRRIEAPWSRCIAASAVAGTFGLILTGLKVLLH
jgi:hypothetical protein